MKKLKQTLQSTISYEYYLQFRYYIRYFQMRYFFKATLKRLYKKKVNRELNLESPSRMSEKVSWLKVNYHSDLMTRCCDKYKVRGYITEKIGAEYLNELIGAYKSFDEIDFSALPDAFALKVNNNSNKQLLTLNKTDVDWNRQRKLFGLWMKQNYYYISGEWCYKNVQPRIICEKHLGHDIINYKFYCFGGTPKIIQVEHGTVADKTLTLNYYDMSWELMPVTRVGHDRIPFDIPKPKLFEEMKGIAYTLSKDFPFVRVDLYEVSGRIIFSELTFYPSSGGAVLDPEDYDQVFGDMFCLPEKLEA